MRYKASLNTMKLNSSFIKSVEEFMQKSEDVNVTSGKKLILDDMSDKGKKSPRVNLDLA